MKKVVSVGALNVDVLLFVDEFCKPDGEVPVNSTSVCSGGQAGNIAAGLGKLGKNVFFFGNIGNDSHTAMLKKDFDACSVDYSFAKKIDKPNNSVYCLIDKTGERMLYVQNNIDLYAGDFSDELLTDTEFIVFSSIIKDDVVDLYVDIARRAKEKGIKIAMDPGNILANLGFENLKPLLELCDIIFPSLGETEMLVGSLDNINKLTDVVPHVLVTCGKDGIRYYQKDKEMQHFLAKPFNENRKIVDSTGAGDCFAAACVAGLMDKKSVEDAILFALLASKLSLAKKGARAMPSLEEIEDFKNE
jgi:sugar/nucleoside kinase (ribokinase family)